MNKLRLNEYRYELNDIQKKAYDIKIAEYIKHCPNFENFAINNSLEILEKRDSIPLTTFKHQNITLEELKCLILDFKYMYQENHSKIVEEFSIEEEIPYEGTNIYIIYKNNDFDEEKLKLIFDIITNNFSDFTFKIMPFKHLSLHSYYSYKIV